MNAFCLCSTGAACLLAGAVAFGHPDARLEDRERFAFAEDRTVALAAFVPGSDPHYFYHVLHALNEDRLADAETLLHRWKNDRQGHAPFGLSLLENRLAVLLHAHHPGRAIARLREKLGWQPTHARQTDDRQDDTPATLDAASLSTEALLNTHFQTQPDALSFLSDDGLPLAVTRVQHTPRLRRDLLNRLHLPVLPNLVSLVDADLNEKDSRGFGSLPIHNRLTLDQLQALGRLRPQLREQQAWIDAVLTRLAPRDAVDLDTHPAEHHAYLERLAAFSASLPASQNSLKAAILYNRLAFDETQAVFDRDRFIDYLKLPRHVSYLPRPLRDAVPHHTAFATLGTRFPALHLPPAPVDEPLVRRYLLHFLKTDADYSAFLPYLTDTFLKPLFAEAKLVNGIGAPADWAALIPPDTFRHIQSRTDIDFAPDNPRFFDPDTPVSLDLYVKNVHTLHVRVYAINTQNYYQIEKDALDLAMNLDGLTPTETLTFTYANPPEHRIRRTLALPALNRRGVWVVEGIGNGISSRMLIQKGRLDVTETQTPAGHAFSVYDEQGRTVTTATAWLDGHTFHPNPSGVIFIPYSNNPRPAHVIIATDGFATRFAFHHATETTRLQAGVHVEREALLRGGQADIIIRPRLWIGNQPAPLSLLKNPRVVVTTRDLRDLTSARTFPDLTLSGDPDTVVSISVPDDLRFIHVLLEGEIQNLALGRTDTLSATATVEINGIATTRRTADLFLGRDADGYYAECRGKNGEPLGGRRFQFLFEHRLFAVPVVRMLKTDENGRIILGALQDIVAVSVRTSANDRQRWHWTLAPHCASQPEALHGTTAQPLLLPAAWPGSDGPTPLAGVSLIETRGQNSVFVHDWTAEGVSIENGLLSLSGLPAGDFVLTRPGSRTPVPVRIIDPLPGSAGRFLFSRDRMIELPAGPPLAITAIEEAGDTLAITLTHATPATRVHVLASRYCDPPGSDAFSNLLLERPVLRQARGGPVVCPSESGRTLSDEARYILDRRHAPQFPGNRLERPGLLLNPWERRDTTAETERLGAGTDFSSARLARHGGVGRPAAGGVDRALFAADASASRADEPVETPVLDFLAQQAVTLSNLKPDKQGRLAIPLDALRGLPLIRVVALDGESTVVREMARRGDPITLRDGRLADGLDPATPHALRKRVTPVPTNVAVTIDAFQTARFVLCDTVEKAFGIFSATSANPVLATFSFITRWNTLEAAEQRRLYSRHACHELNLFLFHKDRPFFDAVIAPTLANKRDTTFVDDWLLGRDLTRHLDASRYARLNAAERALLARRLPPDDAARVSRDLADAAALARPSPDTTNRRFDTALRLGALETERAFAADDPAVLTDATFAGARQAGLPRGRAMAAAEAPAGLSETFALAPTAAPPEERDAERADPFGDEAVLAARETLRRFFRQPEKTKEWAENNYWKQHPEAQDAALIPVNGFWRAYAAHPQGTPFLPAEMLEADASFSEIMLALAVMDLPFAARPHTETIAGPALTITAGSPALLLHRELLPADPFAGDTAPVLTVQRCFRADDRYAMIDGERVEKTVEAEFLAGIVYSAQAVFANATPRHRKLNAILQIPEGALPVGGSRVTTDTYLELEPYATLTHEIHFYFPEAGSFRQFPVTVADLDGRHLARAEAVRFEVVTEPGIQDTSSWAWLSQHGHADDVIAYLDRANLHALEPRLAEIGWRMRDADFFARTLALLRRRLIFSPPLWGYAFLHEDGRALGEYLPHTPFARQVGPVLDTTLLAIDPVDALHYEHLEYAPLINPRVHPVGARHTILNPDLRAHYDRFIDLLAFKPDLDDEDRLAAVYYLMVQDRIAEALALFARVSRDAVVEKLQYDYLHAWLALHQADVETAAGLAAQHRDTPLDHWRTRFLRLDAHLQAIRQPGIAAADADPRDRDATLEALAETEPILELAVEGGFAVLTARHIDAVMLNIYPMDIEPLFSSNPFLRDGSDRFAIIQPTFSTTVRDWNADATTRAAIPAPWNTQNVMIEAVGGGLRRTAASTATSLDVRLVENYGQVIVRDAETGLPVPGAYVKVYRRGVHPGPAAPDRVTPAAFHKDGYTDLLGRFDYYALNPGAEPLAPERLAILVMSPGRGAVIREVAPPRD